MNPEFRQGEQVVSVYFKCTECGKRAEGEYSWADGSGDICNKCVEEDEKSEATPIK